MNNLALEGQRVLLQPLEPAHADGLFECSRSDKLWEHLPIKISTREQMYSFVQSAIANRIKGEEYPFTVIDKVSDQVVGMTRYLRISPIHRTLNIGWTWYAEEVWRTSVNTETKYLLLQHAFEVWGTVRVEIITTTDHLKSQKAIERIGAVKEGILRKKYNNKDYVCYSIVEEEWLPVKARIEGLLKGISN